MTFPVPARLTKATRFIRIGLVALVVCGLLPTLLEQPGAVLGQSVVYLPILAFCLTLSPLHPRRYAWLCFVILAYFCAAVLEAFLLPSFRGVLGMSAVLVIVAVFMTSMYASRWAEHYKGSLSPPHA